MNEALKKTCAADGDSTRRLLENYPALVRLITRASGDPRLAADLLHEAIVTAISKLQNDELALPEKIAGYVFGAAMNHLRNHRRRMDERGDRRIDSDAIENLPAEEHPGGLDQRAIAQEVRRILGSLPTPRDREIVKRFYLDEDEKDTICRDLGLSPLHFDKVIFRARQRMRKLLEQKGFRKSDFFSFLLVCFA
jgi:RNA polymerase sigma-70 factor, ECF subfamily